MFASRFFAIAASAMTMIFRSGEALWTDARKRLTSPGLKNALLSEKNEVSIGPELSSGILRSRSNGIRRLLLNLGADAEILS